MVSDLVSSQFYHLRAACSWDGAACVCVCDSLGFYVCTWLQVDLTLTRSYCVCLYRAGGGADAATLGTERHSNRFLWACCLYLIIVDRDTGQHRGCGMQLRSQPESNLTDRNHCCMVSGVCTCGSVHAAGENGTSSASSDLTLGTAGPLQTLQTHRWRCRDWFL